MTDVLVKPAFVSALPDTGDTTRLGPNAWNAARLFSAGALGDLLYRDTGSATGASWLTAAAGVLTWSGAGAAPTIASTLGVALGGTGLASYAIGDLLYASGATTLAKLADVAAGSVLVSGGAGVAPAWSASPSLTRAFVGNGTAGAPAFSFSNDTDTGIYWTSGDGMLFAYGGAAKFAVDSIGLNMTGAALTFSSGVGVASDVRLSRGAVDLLQLATGDSFYVVSGGVGVGNLPGAAGNVNASSYSVAGVAGFANFGPAHPSSITIVNGIVTACS